MEPMASLRSAFRSPARPHAIAFLVLSAALGNAFLNWLSADVILWPLFLDSSFTILMGVVFGWLPGILTGLATNLLIEVFQGFTGTHWPFAVVNMASGLIAGLMASDKERFWTPTHQLAFLLLLTLVNAILGAFIVVMVFGGLTGTNPDVVVQALRRTGQTMVSAAFLARIAINLADKGLPVVLIYAAHLWAVRRHRRTQESSEPA